MTPWRTLMYCELKNLSLEGRVLDLGGLKGSDYHDLIGGRHSITTVNLDVHGEKCDLSFDLENVFPLAEGSYDAVIAINVMEHLFNYRQFLKEVHRILKQGGTAVVAIPFMVQVHPSPHDYFRYTGETLVRLSKEAGFDRVSVNAVGRGPFTAASQTTFNVLKFSFMRSFSMFAGGLLDRLARLFDRKENFTAEKYPLGYVAVFEKYK